MLNHIEQQCVALTARDKKTKMKDVNIPWDQDDDIETYFAKVDKLEEDLQENYGIEYPTSMKITQAEDEMYRSNMFSKEELMIWEENPWPTRRGSTCERNSRTDGQQRFNTKATLPIIMGLRVTPARKRIEAITA